MQHARILNTYFDSGRPVYEAGSVYPADATVERLVALGHAAFVEVGAPMDQDDSSPVPAENAAPVGEAEEVAAEEPAQQDAPRRGRRKAA